MGKAGGGGGGVSDVYRDGEGWMYWDEDEEWEPQGLLPAGSPSSAASRSSALPR